MSDDLLKRIYVGDGAFHYEPLKNELAWEKATPYKPEPYVASRGLVEAVNTALYLRRPLLLEGEPGCGKTRLAYAVAYELGYPLQECYIRSTSRAQDLLYTYDAVKRLYDIEELRKGKQAQLPPQKKYHKLGPLGEAIRLSAEQEIPSVVLIDEIDKADIDFPNDLLLELDRWRFTVHEVEDETIKYDAQDKPKSVLPLVIITSNREKELPKPFLRRCLFYYVSFPKQETLNGIIAKHFQLPPKELTPLFTTAVKRFWELRQSFSWRKEPGTSELLEWLNILSRDEQNNELTAPGLDEEPLRTLPHLEVLVKTESDLKELKKLD